MAKLSPGASCDRDILSRMHIIYIYMYICIYIYIYFHIYIYIYIYIYYTLKLVERIAVEVTIYIWGILFCRINWDLYLDVILRKPLLIYKGNDVTQLTGVNEHWIKTRESVNADRIIRCRCSSFHNFIQILNTLSHLILNTAAFWDHYCRLSINTCITLRSYPINHMINSMIKKYIFGLRYLGPERNWKECISAFYFGLKVVSY